MSYAQLGRNLALPGFSEVNQSIFGKRFVTPSELLSQVEHFRSNLPKNWWRMKWRTMAYKWCLTNHDNIAGFLSIEEARFLTAVAGYLPEHSIVVELGTFCGKSTRYFAVGCAYSNSYLYAIDLFSPYLPGEGKDLVDHITAIIPNPLDHAMWNLNCVLQETLDHVVFWQKDSKEAGRIWTKEQYQKVDVLFVDADHITCRQDFGAWAPNLADHALVLFHDYTPGPTYGPDGPSEVCMGLLASGWTQAFYADRLMAVTRDPMYWVTLEEAEYDSSREESSLGSGSASTKADDQPSDTTSGP